MAGKRASRAYTLNDADKIDQQRLSTDTKTRSRTKNYTAIECEHILKTCDKFHNIINKNSNRDSDKKTKEKTWQTIKIEFDERCKADGCFVSFLLNRMSKM